jgi:hypothetical protein
MTASLLNCEGLWRGTQCCGKELSHILAPDLITIFRNLDAFYFLENRGNGLKKVIWDGVWLCPGGLHAIALLVYRILQLVAAMSQRQGDWVPRDDEAIRTPKRFWTLEKATTTDKSTPAA